MELSGRRLGEFTLREQIGEGGCAVVYRCEQPRLRRSAVVKVLHERGQRSDAALDRFRREAQLASQLDHPYAAHVYAFGDEEDGLFWIAMELVQGVALDDWLEAHGPMPLTLFVPFFECVADVVHAAHERGIIHRDLKPSNVMVIDRNGRLFPKLLDFGIAKLIGELALPAPEQPAGTEAVTTAPLWAVQRRAQRTRTDPGPKDHRLTRTSSKLGSTAYMSPEQWTAPKAVGTASDIYSLGVLAYEALTGRKPFTADSTHEYYHQHVYVEAPPLGDGFPPEVDRVVRRALAKAPEARHGNALELAAAFRAALRAEPHEQLRAAALQWEDRARSPDLLWGRRILTDVERSVPPKTMSELECSFVVESQRRIRRIQWAQRALVALGALVVVGGLLYRAATKARQAALQTELAQKQTQLAQEQAQLAQEQARSAKEVTEATAIAAKLEQGRAALLHDEMEEARQHLGEAWRRGEQSPSTAFMYARSLQPLRAERARLPALKGRMWSASWSPDGKQIVTTDDAGAQIWDAATYQLLSPLPHGDAVYAATWAPGGRLITAAGDGSVRIWNAATGGLVRELQLRGRAARWDQVVVSPDGRRVAAVEQQGVIAAVWDAEAGTTLLYLALPPARWPTIAFSSNGRWLAVSGDTSVRVFDATIWREVLSIPGLRFSTFAWAPSGAKLITGSADGDVSIWAVPSGTRLQRISESGDPIDAVAFSPDGRLVVTASREGAERVSDVGSGRLLSSGNYLHNRIASIEFDPTSMLVLASSTTGEAAISDAMSSMPITVLQGPGQQLRVARFDPSGRRVAAASWDGTTRIWDASPSYRRWASAPLADGGGLVGGSAPDGQILAVACQDRVTRVWDTKHDMQLAELPALTARHGAPVPFPAVSSAGDRAAIARGNAAELYELPGGRLVRSVAHAAAVTAVAFGPSGELISGSEDGAVLVTPVDGEPLALPPAPAEIDALAELDDDRIAVADARGRVRILARGSVVAELKLPARTRMLRPGPDGRRMVAVPYHAGLSAPATLWDVERQQLVARFDDSQTWSARWVDGGRAILSAHADGAARLWNADGVLRQTYRGGPRFLADAVLSADGAMVVGGGGDGLLRFWDASTGRPLWTMAAHKPYVMGVRLDGHDIVTRGSGGEVARWHLPPPADVIGASKNVRSRP